MRSGQMRLGTVRMDVAAAIQPLLSAQLVATDPRTALVHADLASGVELDGEQTVVFSLRDGSRFHPGADGLASALTATDVRRDFQRRRLEGEFLFTEVVDAIEAPDPLTLVVRLRGPFALLFEYLGDPATAAVRGQARYGAVDLPLSAGPFIPAAVQSEVLLMGANRLFHRPAVPLLDSLALTLADSEAELDREAAAGRLDVRTGGARPLEGVATPDWRAIERPTRGMRGLAMSLLPAASDSGAEAGSAWPFQDQRVRRAVALALDRDALLEVDGGELSGPVGPAFRADALPDEVLRAHPLYQHRPDAARALLEASGHVGLELRLTTSMDRDHDALARAIVEQLAGAGFEPRVVAVPERQWDQALRAGDFELLLVEVADLATPDAGLRLHSSVGLEGAFSPWGYSNPVYDAAMRRALSVYDPAERARRSREAQLLLLDDVPALLPLSSPREYGAVAAGVSGFEWGAYGFNDSYFAARWAISGPRVRSASPDGYEAGRLGRRPLARGLVRHSPAMNDQGARL